MVCDLDQAVFFGDMPAHEYHARHDAISKTMLSCWKQEGRRVFEAKFVTHEMPDFRKSKSMVIGDAVHAVLLEPARIGDFVMYPQSVLAKDGKASTSAAKAFKAEQEALGRTIIREDEWSLMQQMVKAFTKAFKPYLELESSREKSIFWVDDETGLPLRCRCDWMIRRDNYAAVFDIKTCASAHPLAFRKACEDYDYGLQQAHYSEGVRKALGVDQIDFVFLAIENEYPFRCAPYKIKADSVSDSDALRRKMLREIKQCREAGDWSEPWEARTDRLVPQELPLRPWALEMGFDD